MKDKAKSVIVELPHTNITKGGHILHEYQYNTGHGIQTIPNEICGEIRREPGQPQVQQEPIIHLFLEEALGWYSGITVLSIQTTAQSSQSAYRRRDQADQGYAKKKPAAWDDGVVASSQKARLYQKAREPFPYYAQAGNVPSAKVERTVQTQAL